MAPPPNTENKTTNNPVLASAEVLNEVAPVKIGQKRQCHLFLSFSCYSSSVTTHSGPLLQYQRTQLRTMKYFAIWQFDEAYRRATDAIFSMLSRAKFILLYEGRCFWVDQYLPNSAHLPSRSRGKLGRSNYGAECHDGCRTSVFNSGEEKAEVWPQTAAAPPESFSGDSFSAWQRKKRHNCF